jgi:hypothetical protein
MRRLLSGKGLIGTGLIAALGAALWLGWKPCLLWYSVRGLASADEKNRDKWVKRVAWLDADAVPPLLDCLAAGDPAVCANAEAALAYLAHAWGADEPRCLGLAQQLGERFPALSVPGQEAALEWQLALLPNDTKAAWPEAQAKAAGDLLLAAIRVEDRGIRLRTLALAEILLEHAQEGPCLDACRALVPRGLADDDAAIRIGTVHLTLQGPFHADAIMLRQVVPLLRDRDAGVRRAALLAVGPCRQVISEESLLPLLHDADAGVRRLCETALRSRGLRDEQILLGRFLSDDRAAARLEVLPLLEQVELEPGEAATWLRRLGGDPCPAVRAAVARAAARQTDTDLSDLLHQLAQGDASPTVRQLAAFYWKR